MTNRPQSNHTNSRYPGSTYLDLWQRCSILSQQWYEHDIQREHPVVLCGFQNELGIPLHLLPWSKSPLKSIIRLYTDEGSISTLFPPTIFPLLTSRQMRSPAVMRPKCFPSGFIHMYSGNSGSRTEMWPDMPSVKPLREKSRNTAAV